MPVKVKTIEIPEFQTAEQLMSFLLSEFMFMYAIGGVILLTNEDLRILSDSLQRFINSPTRSKNLTATGHYKEEKVK